MDPSLARQTSADHDLTMMPPTIPLSLSAPTSTRDADRIADAIIHSRPYGSTADLARARKSNETAVFGSRTIYPDDCDIEWTDAAAEEIFARVYEGATVRSRNFRVWIVAQAITPSITPGTSPAVLAEVRKVHTLFADPGQRAADGSILAGKSKTSITSSNEF
jgi:hypothetical protein